MKFSVDLFGTYPPPVGGTSIHLQRLQTQNRKHGIDSIVYDTYTVVERKTVDNKYVKSVDNYKKFLRRYFFTRRADIIHSHSHSWMERMVLTLKAKLCGQKIIFTFHSLRDKRDKFSFMQKVAYHFTVKFSDLFIATGTVVRDKMITWGIDEKKIRLIMPFIAPSGEDGSFLPKEIEDFVFRFQYIITANSSNNDHYHGEDLYGHDMCIELMHKLNNKPEVGLIFIMTKISDAQYFEELKQKIADYRLQDRVLFYQGSIDFTSLLKKSSIFVRPTNTDSWSISMSESLSLGIPCVCSNVCKREDAAILFQSRNQEDFNKAIESVLTNYQDECDKLKKITIVDNYDAIYTEYLRLLNK